MRTLILFTVMAFVAADPEYYNLVEIDIDKLINNIDELKEFTDCMLDKIPCNNVYKDYRVNMLEAIQEACKKCAPDVKHRFCLYLQALKTKLPCEYCQFRYKYDPDNQYFYDLEAELQLYSQL